MFEFSAYSLEEYPQFDSAYWGLGAELYGEQLFFSACTHVPNKSAGFFSFNCGSKETRLLFTLDEVLEPRKNYWSQGKIHTRLYQGQDNKYYFGTHFAYPYCMPQKIQYEGGYLLSYDPTTGSVTNHGIMMQGEGIVTLAFDKSRMHCFALTSPSFYFIDYDISSRELVYTSRVTKKGSVCRALGVDNVGNVYGCCESFRVFRYSPDLRRIKFLKTNFSTISQNTAEWISPYKQGANRVGRTLWRCLEYDAQNDLFIGISASDSSIFEFDANSGRFQNLGDPSSKVSTEVYPTLSLAKHNSTYYYSPASGRFDYQISEGIRSACSLVSFNYETKTIRQLGELTGTDGREVYGTAAATYLDNGTLYFLGAVSTANEKTNGLFLGEDGKPYQLALIEIDLASTLSNEGSCDYPEPYIKG